jgi:hypothetical protein
MDEQGTLVFETELNLQWNKQTRRLVPDLVLMSCRYVCHLNHIGKQFLSIVVFVYSIADLALCFSLFVQI